MRRHSISRSGLNWIAREDPTLALPHVIRNEVAASSITRSAQMAAPCGLDAGFPAWRAVDGGEAVTATAARSAACRAGRSGAGRLFPSGAGREIVWDARHTPRLRPQLALLEDKAERAAAEHVVDRFAADCLPRLSGLRAQVIHNDMNFHNLLVDEQHPQRITGLIDFGDMVHGPLALELAMPPRAMETKPMRAVWNCSLAITRLPLTPPDCAVVRFDPTRQALTSPCWPPASSRYR
jgi:hypothetical protein